mgnify:CR=1 FL=1
MDPFGNVLAGPLRGGEGLLSAEIYLYLIVEAKYGLNVIGHYSGGDVFLLTVNKQSRDVKVIRWFVIRM